MTKISVITATFNCVHTIGDCVGSLAQQTHKRVEHIVIDGASRDGTAEFLQGHRQHFATLVSERDKGLYHALNKGLARVTGDVVGFLHADDLYADAGVLRRIAHEFADPGVEAVFGDLVYVSKEAPHRIIRYWRAGEFNAENLRSGWMPPHPTLYLRRRLYEQFGCFDTSYEIAADYDFMLRILTSITGRVIYLPRVLVRMRAGGISNRSLSNVLKKSAEDLRALRGNGVGGVRTLMLKNGSKMKQLLHRPS
ncbi:glycosyltransferase [Rhodoligotrophos appendicifer]|uniref:glycosyltransferase family 2 protein n=1 Tax=Rhodoligotrophos appendicifer TaxID=987056 RepID=UPI00117C6C4F|nr:glycosyltransferase family 2 protein [Rhodoligotrophos appendicifer]